MKFAIALLLGASFVALSLPVYAGGDKACLVAFQTNWKDDNINPQGLAAFRDYSLSIAESDYDKYHLRGLVFNPDKAGEFIALLDQKCGFRALKSFKSVIGALQDNYRDELRGYGLRGLSLDDDYCSPSPERRERLLAMPDIVSRMELDMCNAE